MGKFTDGYKFDKDFDADITMDEIEAVVSYLHRDIIHDGILIAETSKNVVESFPEVVGKTFEEAAVEYILSKSADGTILTGIEEIVRETGDKNYAAQIGFIVGEQYWDKVERKESWEEILKKEGKA